MTYLNREARRAKRTELRRRTRERRSTRERLRSPKISLSNEVRVEGISDQNGGKWLLVTRGETSAIVRRDDYFSRNGTFWSNLADQGLALTRPKSRSLITEAIEDLQSYPQKIYVATHPGHHCGGFVKPDGTVIGRPQAEHFRVVLSGLKVPLSQEGSLRSWKRMIRRFMRGQAVFTMAVCLGFVSSLLEVLGEQNFGVDLFGKTSAGKTTALNLLASVWGAPLKHEGSIALSLRTTTAGFEQHMLARSGAAFVGDEVNQLSIRGKEQGVLVGDLGMMLAEGRARERHNDAADETANVAFLFTSNVSLPEQLGGVDPANVEAILVRLISVAADAGKNLGVLDRLPKGFESSGPAIKALEAELKANHGCAADAWLKKLVRALRRNEDALKAKISRYVDEFVTATEVDHSDGPKFRRARAIGLIYAAGRLASAWGVLPLRQLKKPLLECYRRSASAPQDQTRQLTAPERIKTYVKANQSKLRDLDKRKPRTMDDTALNAHPGFLNSIKGSRYLLIRRERLEKLFGADTDRVIEGMKGIGRLYSTDGNQAQKRVRKNQPKDRVYAFRLN